ncbi:ZIP family metal transporter [Flavobacterium sp.]|uniref:ZIP family metal transporter n=1 Tax=Flavobacterium sp. TaxID=239 RepID=UPI003F6A0A99
MNYSIYIFPFIAVLIGYLIANFIQPKNKKNLKLLLAFSGAFLLSLTVMHLLPEVYESESLLHEGHNHEGHSHGTNTIGIFIMIGIVFQIILEYFSKGAEHGHVHGHDKMNTIPWLLFFSLCLHALLEGMPISQHNELAYGIAIHHFPIAIILTLFFINAELNKKAILFFMLIFAFMTPLGTYISSNLSFLTEYYTQISGVVIGILFHISSTIIFESSEGHKFNLTKLIAIILGIVLAVFV